MTESCFSFVPMNEEFAHDIVSWHYEGMYAFYDMSADKEDLQIFMNREYWEDFFRAVVDEQGSLVGWATFYSEKDEFWLSLGLRPDLTGQGLGIDFVGACVEYAKSNYDISNGIIKLAVAEFNERAAKVYRRIGFHVCDRETRDTHIGQVPFIVMEKTVTN